MFDCLATTKHFPKINCRISSVIDGKDHVSRFLPFTLSKINRFHTHIHMASSGKQKHTDQMVGNHFVYVHNERQKQCVSSTRQENNACRLEWFINKIRGRNFKRSNLIGAFEQHDYIIGLNSNASHSLLNSLLITNPPCTSGSPSPLSWQRRRRFRRRVVWHPPLPSTKPWTWWRTARPNWGRRKPRKSHIQLAKQFSLKSCQFSD